MDERAVGYVADKIFTGEEWLHHHAVVVEGGVIRDIVAEQLLPSSLPIIYLNGAILAPAFIDLQIYGAHERLLCEYPEPDALYRLQDYCRRGGAAFCMPTVATNTEEVFRQCIDAVRNYWKEGGEGVLGLHLEGPWINSIKRGAHVESLIHVPDEEEVRRLLDYGEGVIKFITLAPEVCSARVIDMILERGIVISAGHSNATYDEAMRSFRQGITTITHLFNAMSPLQHRSPGLVGAALDDAHVMSSIIPDGHHVDYAAIRIAKRAMGERLFVITDAVTGTDKGPYQHYLAGDKYESAGILSGSALTMAKAFSNLVEHAGIERGEALRMCSLYPARLMKMDDRVGLIKKGYLAKMIALNSYNEADFIGR